MDPRDFEASVLEYLVLERGFPRSALQPQLSVGRSLNGGSLRTDIAVLDPKRSEVIVLLEVKASREHKALRVAVSQLLQYRALLQKPHIPLYLVFAPLPGSGRQFEISQILPDGSTKEIDPDEFPSYDALIAIDKSGAKASRAANVKTTIDTFQVTCVGLALVTTVALTLDLYGVLQLTTKQLALAGVSAALLILPFAAKFKMLGIEFERQKPSESNES